MKPPCGSSAFSEHFLELVSELERANISCCCRCCTSDSLPDYFSAATSARTKGQVMQDPTRYASQETLRDGTTVTVRAARADDGPRIKRAFHNLERDTVYTRFFGYKADVSEAELSRITGADFDRAVALLVTVGAGEDEVVIGGASYFVADNAAPPRSAELAFLVEEDYQGRGLASALLQHMIRIARTKRLDQFEADVLARNWAMLRVFRQSGLPMTLRREGDVVHVVLALGGALSSEG
jgi:GNAT superfamily N-acetyltransferase